MDKHERPYHCYEASTWISTNGLIIITKPAMKSWEDSHTRTVYCATSAKSTYSDDLLHHERKVRGKNSIRLEVDGGKPEVAKTSLHNMSALFEGHEYLAVLGDHSRDTSMISDSASPIHISLIRETMVSASGSPPKEASRILLTCEELGIALIGRYNRIGTLTRQVRQRDGKFKDSFRAIKAQGEREDDLNERIETTLLLGKELAFPGTVESQDPVREDVPTAIKARQPASTYFWVVVDDKMLKFIIESPRVLGPGGVLMGGTVPVKHCRGRADREISELHALARSSLDDKRILIQRLKALGDNIAVTGNRTNDVPAKATTDNASSTAIAGIEAIKEASTDSPIDINFLVWGRAVNAAVKSCHQFQAIVSTIVGLARVSAAVCSDPTSVLTAMLLSVNLTMDVFAALALAARSHKANNLIRTSNRKARAVSPSAETKEEVFTSRQRSTTQSTRIRLAASLRRSLKQPLLAAVILVPLLPTTAAQDTNGRPRTAGGGGTFDVFLKAAIGICILALSACFKVASPLFGILMAALAVAWPPVRNDPRTSPQVLCAVFGLWGFSTIVYGFTQFYKNHMGQLYLLTTLVLTVALVVLFSQVWHDGIPGIITCFPPMSIFAVSNIPTLLMMGESLILHIGSAILAIARLSHTRTEQDIDLELDRPPRSSLRRTT